MCDIRAHVSPHLASGSALFKRQDLFLSLELTVSLHPTGAGTKGASAMPSFLYGCWGLNSGSPACVANTSLTEPSPQPHSLCFDLEQKYFPLSQKVNMSGTIGEVA